MTSIAKIASQLPDCGRRHPDPEDGKLAVDTAVAPRRVLARYPQGQAADRGDRARTPGPATGAPASESTPDQVAMPAQDHVRDDQQPKRAQRLPGQPRQQRRQERPILLPEPRTLITELRCKTVSW